MKSTEDKSSLLPFASSIFKNLKTLTTSSYTRQGEEFAHYSYRTHFSIKQDIRLLHSFYELEKKLNIFDFVLSRFITILHAGDFINWTKKETGVTAIGSLFLFPVTPCAIEFETGLVCLKAGETFSFSAFSPYRVPPTDTCQKGIIWILSEVPENA